MAYFLHLLLPCSGILVFFSVLLGRRYWTVIIFRHLFTMYRSYFLYQVFSSLSFAKWKFSRLKITWYEGVPNGNWQDELGSLVIMLPNNKVNFLTNRKQNWSLNFSSAIIQVQMGLQHLVSDQLEAREVPAHDSALQWLQSTFPCNVNTSRKSGHDS